MKQNEDWTEQLRTQLDDYEAPVPKGMWERIEQQLPKTTPRKRAAIVPLWLPRVAAVALVLVVIGASILWLQPSDVVNEALSHGESAAMTESKFCDDQANEALSPPQSATLPAKALAIAISKQKTMHADTMQNSLETELEAVPTGEAEHHSPTPRTEQEVEKKKVKEALREEPLLAEKPSKRKKRSWELALYAQNAPQTEDASNGVNMSHQLQSHFMSLSSGGGHQRMAPAYLAGYEEQQHHHRPFSLGLTASYPLTNRLSLGTGIVYTRLTSDFINITPNYQTQRTQRLDYLGVPLTLNYRLWQHRRLSFYASAQVEADWNIKARIESDGTSLSAAKDRLQWSVAGALGVQMNLLPQLGLYAEPRISHHPDNGSAVRNYYKESPTGWSFQVGLRWDIR